MKIVVDTHTHSISSGHAYSTVQEMAAAAKEKGIEIMAVTDHGPAMEGGACFFHFGNLKVLPEKIYGVRILKGIEANIIDYEGSIDLPIRYLKKMEFVIASLHDIVISPSTVEDHTNALVNALSNPYVDAVGHPGNSLFEVDIERVVNTAKKYNKLIEINNSSFFVRRGSEYNCRCFIQKCKEYGVRVVCGSDAHISFDVGKFDRLLALLREVDMPEELILSTSSDKFKAYLREKQLRINGVKQETFMHAF